MFNQSDKQSECAHIYRILFPSGKVYIGQSWDYIVRFRSYKNLQCEKQPKLYNALNYYGWENTEQELLDICYSQEELNDAEDYWINYYDAIHNGYNCKEGGSNGKHLPETCEKIGISHQKRWEDMTPEEYEAECEKHRGENNGMFGRLAWNSGQEMPPEWCEEHSLRGEYHPMFGKDAWNSGLTGELYPYQAWNTGMKMSEEYCEKYVPRGEEHHMFGKPSWNKGLKMPEETVEKQRGEKNHRWGKDPWNKGTKGVMVSWNKGMKMSPEYCEKMPSGENHHFWGKPAWNTGLKMPEETCEKQRGEKNHRYGKTGPGATKVEIDGIIYESKKAAAEALNMDKRTVIKLPGFKIISESSHKTTRNTKKGKDSPRFGKSPTNSKKVEIDGVVYDSMTAAGKALGINRKSVHKLPGFRILPKE